MQTESSIEARGKSLVINITPGRLADFITLEISSPNNMDTVSIVVFTEDKVGFLELLRKVAGECLLRVRDEEQTGERGDA